MRPVGTGDWGLGLGLDSKIFLQRSIHVRGIEFAAKIYQELVNSFFMPEPISQTLREEWVLVIIGVSLLSTKSFLVQHFMFAKETR